MFSVVAHLLLHLRRRRQVAQMQVVQAQAVQAQAVQVQAVQVQVARGVLQTRRFDLFKRYKLFFQECH